MAHYRLYFLNPLGHIERVEEFEAADDASAIAQATAEGPCPKELWCRGRRVGQWPAPSLHSALHD